MRRGVNRRWDRGGMGRWPAHRGSWEELLAQRNRHDDDGELSGQRKVEVANQLTARESVGLRGGFPPTGRSAGQRCGVGNASLELLRRCVGREEQAGRTGAWGIKQLELRVEAYAKACVVSRSPFFSQRKTAHSFSLTRYSFLRLAPFRPLCGASPRHPAHVHPLQPQPPLPIPTPPTPHQSRSPPDPPSPGVVVAKSAVFLDVGRYGENGGVERPSPPGRYGPYRPGTSGHGQRVPPHTSLPRALRPRGPARRVPTTETARNRCCGDHLHRQSLLYHPVPDIQPGCGNIEAYTLPRSRMPRRRGVRYQEPHVPGS